MCLVQCTTHSRVQIIGVQSSERVLSIVQLHVRRSKRKASYYLAKFQAKFMEEKTKEAAACEFHKVLTTHQL